MRRNSNFINLRKKMLSGEVLTVLESHKPQLLTCREIAEALSHLKVTATQVYDSIRKLSLADKSRLQIEYGSGLFKPNKYGIK